LSIVGVYEYFGVWSQFSVSAEIFKLLLGASVVASVFLAATGPKAEAKSDAKND